MENNNHIKSATLSQLPGQKGYNCYLAGISGRRLGNIFKGDIQVGYLFLKSITSICNYPNSLTFLELFILQFPKQMDVLDQTPLVHFTLTGRREALENILALIEILPGIGCAFISTTPYPCFW